MSRPPAHTLRALCATVIALAAAACARDAPLQPDGAPSAARIVVEPAPGTPREPVYLPDRYVVVMADGADDPGRFAEEVAARYKGQIHWVYRDALRGFAATLPPQAVMELEREPRIRLVAKDAAMYIHQVVQPSATWGLDRVDQVFRNPNNKYMYERTGAGVTVYVLDTGIQGAHPDFGGRVTAGHSVFGGSASDCHTHGTHVAGTIGGATWGVAKAVTLVPVRVFQCPQGPTLPPVASTSSVIAGVDWVTQHHVSGPAVINMSLGGPDPSLALDLALGAPWNEGIFLAASAGNDNVDACTQTPARVWGVLTVAASRSDDTKAGFSNWGTCVDLFAPGENITSAHPAGNWTGKSGTSMAAPHAAGAGALWLQDHPGASAMDVHNALTSRATTGVLAGPLGTGSPSRLLHALRLHAYVGYYVHVRGNGWMYPDVYDNQMAGTTGEHRRMEAIVIFDSNLPPGASINYEAHVQGIGWQGARSVWQLAGTTGQNKRMEALKVWLTNAPPGWGICYQAHVQGIGWQSYRCNGAVAGTTGQHKRMEAIRIYVYHP